MLLLGGVNLEVLMMGSLLRVPDVKKTSVPEGLALQMCGTGTTQMIKSFMLSEKT